MKHAWTQHDGRISRGAADRDILAALRQWPHMGVLLGCYALLLNLAFAALPVPTWLVPSDAVALEADGGWSFNPLASLCRYAAEDGSDEGDRPAGTSLACAKCCAPTAAVTASAVPLVIMGWARSSDRPTRVSDSGAGLRRASADLIRAPPAQA